VLSYWREFAARYVTALCALPDIAEGPTKPPLPVPAAGELDNIAAAAPPMTGAEYLTAAVLADLWRGMDASFDAELADAKLGIATATNGKVCWSSRWRWRTCSTTSNRSEASDNLPPNVEHHGASVRPSSQL
jgi:hypothetical protein